MSNKPDAAAVRAIEAYYATGGESPLEQDITAEYRPLVKAAQKLVVALAERGGNKQKREFRIQQAWEETLAALREVVEGI